MSWRTRKPASGHKQFTTSSLVHKAWMYVLCDVQLHTQLIAYHQFIKGAENTTCWDTGQKKASSRYFAIFLFLYQSAENQPKTNFLVTSLICLSLIFESTCPTSYRKYFKEKCGKAILKNGVGFGFNEILKEKEKSFQWYILYQMCLVDLVCLLAVARIKVYLWVKMSVIFASKRKCNLRWHKMKMHWQEWHVDLLCSLSWWSKFILYKIYKMKMHGQGWHFDLLCSALSVGGFVGVGFGGVGFGGVGEDAMTGGHVALLCVSLSPSVSPTLTLLKPF